MGPHPTTKNWQEYSPPLALHQASVFLVNYPVLTAGKRQKHPHLAHFTKEETEAPNLTESLTQKSQPKFCGQRPNGSEGLRD